MKKERLLELAGIQLNEGKQEKVLMELDSALERAVFALSDGKAGSLDHHDAVDIVKDRCTDFLENVL